MEILGVFISEPENTKKKKKPTALSIRVKNIIEEQI